MYIILYLCICDIFTYVKHLCLGRADCRLALIFFPLLPSQVVPWNTGMESSKMGLQYYQALYCHAELFLSWLWQLTPLAVAVSTFCCGSIHFFVAAHLWPWQYPLLVVVVVVAISTFCCGRSGVLLHVVCGRCQFRGYIQAISGDNFSTEDRARANS